LTPRRLIITGDDFGLDDSVNEAIERSHRDGVLNTTSLMVGAPAAADAVARARRLPALRVGLHVVVARDRPVLPAHDIPDLVDAAGNLRSNLVEAGFRYFFRPAIRRQLRSEIAAQFAAFRDTGLPLDHVNAHNHMHFHPTVLTYILDIGRDYGVRAIRLPYEPFLPSWRASGTGFFGRLGTSLFLAPWSALMRQRIGRRGLARNDYVFGMYDSGRLDAERVLALLDRLPPGVTELYFHPATAGTASPVGYGRAAELAALVEPRVAEKIRALGIDVIGFGDLTDPRSS